MLLPHPTSAINASTAAHATGAPTAPGWDLVAIFRMSFAGERTREPGHAHHPIRVRSPRARSGLAPGEKRARIRSPTSSRTTSIIDSHAQAPGPRAGIAIVRNDDVSVIRAGPKLDPAASLWLPGTAGGRPEAASEVSLALDALATRPVRGLQIDSWPSHERRS